MTLPDIDAFDRPRLAFIGSAIAAGLWLTLQAVVPGLQDTGLSLFLLRIVVHVLILAGAWQGLRRTDLTAPERTGTWLAIAIPLTIWFAGAWSIAGAGLLRTDGSRIPLLPLMVFVPTGIAFALLWRSRRIGLLLDAIPATWLIGLQAYRVVGGIFFLGWLAGKAPAVFAWPAGTGDVITGLMALPVATALASGRAGSAKSAVIWNLFGVADLILAVILGALTSPGQLHLLALDHPNLMVGTYPTALIPAFTVPTSFLLHALSLRQLRRRSRGQTNGLGV